MQLPPNLKEMWKREPEWLDELPRVVRELAAAWDLALEEPIDTPRSLVVPAGDVVLKLNAPSHVEADHEADALLQWDGRGAVRVVARADEHRAFLIERCRPGTRLWDSGADEPSVVAELLPRLWSEGTEPHPFRLAADEARRWDEEVAVRYEHGGRPFEQALVDLASDVFRTADPGAKALVNQDLHGGNILSATREPWLVIDPKPLVGEREFAVAPIVRDFELGHSKEQALARLDRLTSELGLDKERSRWWTIGQSLAWFSMDGLVMDTNVEVARWLAEAA
jgi:streptomycin 6-kinase